MAIKTKHGLFYRWGKALNEVPDDKRTLFHTELGSQGRLLVLVHTLFLLSEALSGTFVNVYLWKENVGYALIGWYNVSFFLAMQITFMMSGKWVKVYNKMSCLRTGIAVAASFYLAVLLLGDLAPKLIIPLGFLQGVGHGFFWFSYNIVLFEITNRANRNKFNGLAGVFGSLVGMTAPLGAGYLISEMTGLKGYTTIFAISLGIYVGAVILSFFLRKRKSGGTFTLTETYTVYRRSRTWKKIFLAMIGQGANESIFNFLVGLLVFIATNTEWKLGMYTFITSAVAFVSFYIAGKFLSSKWRSQALLLGTILTTLAVVPLFFELNYTTLLIMGIGISLFSPLFFIPAVSTIFDAIGKSSQSAQWKVEYIIIRETGLNIGRLITLGIFIALVHWRDDALVLNTLLLAASIVQLMTWYYLKKVHV
ncbi:MFS transporter [Ammoniphilus resinae]|uniref:YQGE family putative transporter n=1 Tax=Ammoniphilus resinae TaxID=861532 RepID=A0ABS4GJQ8_9BACL|nr:MFS transporter [Ammoniphilus resinae]MBP1930387.1 YQGE family putative transporter [Ammoniphilus resinae]